MEVDEDGQDPLNIAVQAANADIVTLWVEYFTSIVDCPREPLHTKPMFLFSLSLSLG